jgi:hypothetical protein
MSIGQVTRVGYLLGLVAATLPGQSRLLHGFPNLFGAARKASPNLHRIAIFDG